MDKLEFQKLLTEEIIILDGATGSNLQKRGMPVGACPELWIMEHRNVLSDLQQEYAAAGSNIVYAPTFSANSIKLKDYDLEKRTKELNQTLVEISKEAVKGKAFVAGDVTMTGALLEPMGDLTFDELVEVYREQISCLSDAGVDLLVVETMLSLQETRAAVIAAREVCDLPVMATLSFGINGKTMYGVSAGSAAAVLQGLGVDAVGMNCSSGPDRMLDVLEEMKKVALIPVIVKPNAGMPKLDAQGHTVYDMEAEEFSVHMEKMAASGAGLVGGCCGTSPEYIKAVKEKIAAKKPIQPMKTEQIVLASEREVYVFKPGQSLQIGREIDFSNNIELVEEYKEDMYDTALDLAFEMEAEDIICISAKHYDVNEKKALLDVLSEVTRSVNKPCMISTDDPDTVSYVLRNFSGIIAIELNHNLKEWETKIKSIAKSYGAPVVTIDKKIIYC